MPLPVVTDTATAAWCRSGFDAAILKPGDQLIARIAGMTPTGRTWVQVAGCRALAGRPLGGGAGDVVRFEVVPGTKQTGPGPMAGETGSGTAAHRSNAPFTLTFRLPGRTVRLNVILKTVSPRNHPAEKAMPPPVPSSAAGMPLDMAAVIQTALPTPAARALAAWLDRMRRFVKPPAQDRPLPPRVTSNGHHDGLRRSGTGDSATRQPNRSGEAFPADLPAAKFHLDGIPIHFRLKRRPGQKTPLRPSRVVEAAFLVWPEHAGPIRTDVRLGPGTLTVVLRVETEDCRLRFHAALSQLKAALAPLAAHCDCRVEVAPERIQAFFEEDGRHPKNPSCAERVR